MKQYLSAKQLGLVLIVISVLLFSVFVTSTLSLVKAADDSCSAVCGKEMDVCPHTGSIPLQSYLGFTLTFILAGFGAYSIFSGKKYQEELTEKEKKLEQTIATLDTDDKKICDTIKESDGAILQSEVITKTGFTKVKVSRILDKLEGRGLIERRRQGMTNLVLLKRK